MSEELDGERIEMEKNQVTSRLKSESLEDV